MTAARTLEGEVLTAEALHLLAPLLDGKPCDLAVEVAGAVMMAALIVGCTTREGMVTVLRRYARAIDKMADDLP